MNTKLAVPKLIKEMLSFSVNFGLVTLTGTIGDLFTSQLSMHFRRWQTGHFFHRREFLFATQLTV